MNAATLLLCLALGGAGEKEIAIAHEAIYRSNLERVKEGLAPLKLGEKEMAAAMWMAQDQAKDNAMRHIDSLGRDFPERVKSFGVEDATGENCAAGQPTPERVITSWLGSPKHRTNMLRKDAKWIGVGYAPADGTFRHYWTMVLSRGPGYPAIIENESPTIDRDEVSLYVHGEGTVKRIRIANDGGAWSDWMPHQPVVKWTLSPGKGTKKVSVEMMDASGRTRTAEDEIQRS
ncbi:MAG TPA: CAP domain-containing protein [Fimbriimonadaceae bacterium]|nr:CAP domain-containing protein [Fimbriimonadaceae bacterium]